MGLDISQKPLYGDEGNNSRHHCAKKEEPPIFSGSAVDRLQDFVGSSRKQRGYTDEKRELGCYNTVQPAKHGKDDSGPGARGAWKNRRENLCERHHENNRPSDAVRKRAAL